MLAIRAKGTAVARALMHEGVSVQLVLPLKAVAIDTAFAAFDGAVKGPLGAVSFFVRAAKTQKGKVSGGVHTPLDALGLKGPEACPTGKTRSHGTWEHTYLRRYCVGKADSHAGQLHRNVLFTATPPCRTSAEGATSGLGPLSVAPCSIGVVWLVLYPSMLDRP